MNLSPKYLAFGILVTIRSLFADFCQDNSDDLAMILQEIKGISGKFDRMIPFPDQGGSFINQVFLIYTDQGEKLVLKLENLNWENEKTTNEVLALEFLNRNTTIPVPKILAFENSIQHSPLKREYIFMTLMQGTPLNHEFNRIYSNPNLYRHVLEQLADVLAQLKSHSFSTIGSIKDPNSNSLKSPVDFAGLGYDAPCDSFSEYARRWLSY